MVSSSGFRATAVEKAAAYNIRCLTLDQVAKFNWSVPALGIFHRNITANHMTVTFPNGTDLTGEI